MNRRCVCGEYIPYSWSLCKGCLEVYGADRDAWPAWLSFAVSDTQREIDYNRTHDEVAYNDEYDYVGSAVIKGQHYSSSMGWGAYSDVD